MILFTILAIILVALMTFAVLTATAGGIAIVVVFGDLIVCVLLIWFIVRLIRGRKKKK